MKIWATEETMRCLGFEEKTPQWAIQSGYCSTASLNGDPVWFHPLSRIWFQGKPQGDQLFSSIFQAGAKAGDQARLSEIREALGL